MDRLGGAPIRLRTTATQWFGLALVALAVVPGLMYAVYVVVGELVGNNPVRDLVRFVAALYSLLLAVRLAARLISRGGQGVDVDRVGIRPATRKATRLAAWPAITDIRVRRGLLRRRVVVYSDRGGRWWLPVPYSGLLLARDPRFDEKVRTLREMWEANRYGLSGVTAPGGREPGAAADPDAEAAVHRSAVDQNPYGPPVEWATAPALREVGDPAPRAGGDPGVSGPFPAPERYPAAREPAAEPAALPGTGPARASLARDTGEWSRLDPVSAVDDQRSPYAPPHEPERPEDRAMDLSPDSPPPAASGGAPPVSAKKSGRRTPGRHRRG
jgi:hypothetical protein